MLEASHNQNSTVEITAFVLFYKCAEKLIGRHVSKLCEINSKVAFNAFSIVTMKKKFRLILNLQETFSVEWSRRSHVFIAKD